MRNYKAVLSIIIDSKLTKKSIKIKENRINNKLDLIVLCRNQHPIVKKYLFYSRIDTIFLKLTVYKAIKRVATHFKE